MSDGSGWRYWVAHVIVPVVIAVGTGGGLVGYALKLPPDNGTAASAAINTAARPSPTGMATKPVPDLSPPQTSPAPSPLPIIAGMPDASDQPEATPVVDASVAADAGSPAAAAQLLATDYWDIWSRTNADMLDRLPDFYAATVLFYDKSMPLDGIMPQKAKFAQRWPVRSFTVSPGSMETRCDGGVCRVTGEVYWETRRPDNGPVSKGLASFMFGVADGRIVEESSAVLRREVS